MDSSNKTEFAKIFYAMGEYYDKNVSTDLLVMYFDDLLDFSIENIKYGAKCHRQDPKQGTFFPKPADIIRHLRTGNISTEDKAELAWAQIIGKIRSTGSYGNLKLDDKQALVSLRSFISWKELCMMDVSKLTWAKKEFISMYSTYENTPLEMLPNSLPGLIELQNHKEKYADQGAKSVASIMNTINKKRLNTDN